MLTKRSQYALVKVRSRELEDGTLAHGFHTLLASLGAIVRNIYRPRGTGDDFDALTFEMTNIPAPKQQRAFNPIRKIQPLTERTIPNRPKLVMQEKKRRPANK